jgi:chromosome segregation ATPase
MCFGLCPVTIEPGSGFERFPRRTRDTQSALDGLGVDVLEYEFRDTLSRPTPPLLVHTVVLQSLQAALSELEEQNWHLTQLADKLERRSAIHSGVIERTGAALPQQYRDRLVQSRERLSRVKQSLKTSYRKVDSIQSIIEHEKTAQDAVKERIEIWRTADSPSFITQQRSNRSVKKLLDAQRRRESLMAAIAQHHERAIQQFRAQIDTGPDLKRSVEALRSRVRSMKEGHAHLTSPREIADLTARETQSANHLLTLKAKETALVSRIRDLVTEMVALHLPIPPHTIPAVV